MRAHGVAEGGDGLHAVVEIGSGVLDVIEVHAVHRVTPHEIADDRRDVRSGFALDR